MTYAATHAPPALIVQLANPAGVKLPGVGVVYRADLGDQAPIARYLRDLSPNAFADRWSYALSDSLGYLQPDGCAVETLKLSANVRYQFYLIAHPSAALARAVTKELNGELPVEITRGWDPPFAETLKLQGRDAKQQLVLEVMVRPESFYPRGTARYGGWVLYEDMPYAQAPSVRQAVKRLQEDLGALRYPIGGHYASPYVPQASTKWETGNVGQFDARLLSAVVHFQQLLLDGAAGRPNAARVHDRATAHGGASAGGSDKEWPVHIASSHAYLHTTPTVMAPSAAGTGELPLEADGVAGAVTQRAVEAWVEAGLRRPGKVLVAVANGYGGDYPVWLREEAAESFAAWGALVKALGFEQGVVANHTYRSPHVDVGRAGFGRDPTSIHKSGLAVDVGLASNYADVHEKWNIV